jgi:hypothetical protein
MSHFHGNSLLGASGSQGYEIGHSLRFNDDDTAYLNFTPGSAGNQKTWTWSAWIKRSGSLGSYQHIFNPVNGGDGVNEATLRFDNSNRFQVYDSGGARGNLVTTQVFRDVSAWYHIVVALDTTQATASNRLKIYVNGQQVTAFDTETYPSQDTTWGWNGTQRHDLGRYAYGSSLYFDGYIAETHFVDGTQLAPSNFGETDPVTGAWIPKEYSGSHGSQGWYLDFSDNSGVTATTLGKDSSGNGNNWTPNNFSVTAGAGNDSLEDTPTNNWCTLNPLNPTSATLSNGNLDFFRAGKGGATSTFGVDSGKFYYEVTGDANVGSGGFAAGFVQQGYNTDGSTDIGQSATSFGCRFAVSSTTFKPLNGTTTTISGQTNDTTTVFAFAVNFDNGAVEVFRNGSSIHTQTLTLPEGKFFPAVASETSSANKNIQINFGQRAFSYTPPAGYKALNTENLPVPTVKDGTEYFNTVLWTGNGSTQSITGVGFQPDFVWLKSRSQGYDHGLVDAVRGVTQFLESNTTDVEATVTNYTTSFDSDGFSLGVNNRFNQSSATNVAWNWKADGGGSVNADGTILSVVSANTEAGFSIVSWAAEATAGTVGHGLGVAPHMIIMKDRDTSAYPWLIYHKEVGIDKYLAFTTATTVSNTTVFSTAPTSTVFDPGTGLTTGNSYGDVIAYCFSSVEGYSKFGSYTGNAVSGDGGPFVHLNFRPTWVLIKSSTVATSWYLFDDTRGSIQTQGSDAQVLFPDTAAAEDANGGQGIDFLSNGFKVRAANGYGLNNSATYIYMAFAENPFKYANAR